MLREGMFIAERYEILERIGTGGMSDVYKAKCHKLNRLVAIKVLKNEYCGDKTFVAKFRAEAQAAAGLMHANVVNVYDVGEENGIYYIVMELVEGITLKKYIEKKGRLGIREAVSIAIQVAQGIEAAHKHHIIHRDIKPQNIIISKEGKVKVTDFGIARAASSNTINSSVMGSVHYISPEQARGGYSDEKSDIYSFGITFFEMITGRVPFQGDTTVAVALQHIQDDMESPKLFVPDIPVSVEKIILKCTQKKTERRYQNVTDLIADLKRSLVTPDEDFVVISSAVMTDAPTRMIAEDELAEIKKTVDAGIMADNMKSTPAYTEMEDKDEETEEYDDDEDDRDIPETKKIDKVITIVGIAVGVIIIIVTIIVVVKMVGLLSGGSSSSSSSVIETTAGDDDGLVKVPTVINMTVSEATDTLNKLGLGIDVTEDYSSLYDKGMIFDQSVDAGESVSPNTTIIVTVSLGAETFPLPNVVGNTQASAETALRNLKLSVTYLYEDTDDTSLVGTIKSTDPVSGTNVLSGDTITLTVYKAPDVVNEVVPNITGMTLARAQEELAAKGFTYYEITYAYDDKIAKDLVISQGGASSGTTAPVTTTITIVVSSGKEVTTEEETTTEEATTEETTTAAEEETTTEEPTTAAVEATE